MPNYKAGPRIAAAVIPPIQSYTPTPINIDAKEARRLYKRLMDAAVSFWPTMSKDEWQDRVGNTICELLSRAKRGETHTASWWAKHMFRRSHDKALRIREAGVDDALLEKLAGSTHPDQVEYAAAMEALRLLKYLPERHRRVVELRADGANPVEISEETGIAVPSVLDILKEARLWLSDGGCYLANHHDQRRLKDLAR